MHHPLPRVRSIVPACLLLLLPSCSDEAGVVESPGGVAALRTLSGTVRRAGGAPLEGMRVRELGGGPSTRTDATGDFLLVDLRATDRAVIEVDGGSVALPGSRFPRIVLSVDLRGAAVSALERPVVLPDLLAGGASGGVLLDADGALLAPLALDGGDARVGLEGEAGTRVRLDGEVPSGPVLLGVAAVAPHEVPVALPAGLLATGLAYVEPGSAAFEPPLTLRLPNAAGLAVGTSVDVWSLDAESGEWSDRSAATGNRGLVRAVDGGTDVLAAGVVATGGLHAAVVPKDVACATNVTGRVVDSVDGRGVAGVSIALSTGEAVTTDLDGAFRIRDVAAYDAALAAEGECAPRAIGFELRTPAPAGSVQLEGEAPAARVVPGGETALFDPPTLAVDIERKVSVAGLLAGPVDEGRPVQLLALPGLQLAARAFPELDGSFHATGLEAGGYRASYRFPGDAEPSERDLEVGASFLTVIVLQPGAPLEPAAPAGLAYAENPALYTVGVPIDANLPAVQGFVERFLVGPALPPGLELDAVTGVVSGTPSAAAASTAFTVTAENAFGSTSVELVLEVQGVAPSDLSYAENPATYTVGVPSAPNAPSFVGTADAFSVDPALPPDLALDPATGVLSGTPATPGGPTVHTVTASNDFGTAQVELSLTVEPNPAAQPLTVRVQRDDDDLYRANAVAVPGAVVTLTHAGSLDVLEAVTDDQGRAVFPDVLPPVTATAQRDTAGALAFGGELFGTGNPTRIDVGDLDEDGDEDVVSLDGFFLDFLFQEGGGLVPGFSLAIPAGEDPQAVAAADLDGDGDLDLVVADGLGDRLLVAFQGAPGAFAFDPDPLLLAPGDGGRHVEPADLDGDGDVDLAVSCGTTSDVVILRQSAPGEFEFAASLTGAASGPTGSVAFDLEGDGDLDLGVAGQNDGVSVFVQGAPGSFTALPGSPFTHPDVSSPLSIDAGQLDGDGRPDLVTANSLSDNVTVFHQTAPGFFEVRPEGILDPTTGTDLPTSAVAADLDGDGDDDVVSTSFNTGRLEVYLQTLPGFFAPLAQPVLGLDSAREVLAAELDGDPGLDLVTVYDAPGGGVGVFLQSRTVVRTAASVVDALAPSGEVGLLLPAVSPDPGFDLPARVRTFVDASLNPTIEVLGASYWAGGRPFGALLADGDPQSIDVFAPAGLPITVLGQRQRLVTAIPTEMLVFRGVGPLDPGELFVQIDLVGFGSAPEINFVDRTAILDVGGASLDTASFSLFEAGRERVSRSNLYNFFSPSNDVDLPALDHPDFLGLEGSVEVGATEGQSTLSGELFFGSTPSALVYPFPEPPTPTGDLLPGSEVPVGELESGVVRFVEGADDASAPRGLNQVAIDLASPDAGLDGADDVTWTVLVPAGRESVPLPPTSLPMFAGSRSYEVGIRIVRFVDTTFDLDPVLAGDLDANLAAALATSAGRVEVLRVVPIDTQ